MRHCRLGGCRRCSAEPAIAAWVPESSLPLWVIKGYEEKARAEEARRASAQAEAPASVSHLRGMSIEPAPGDLAACMRFIGSGF